MPAASRGPLMGARGRVPSGARPPAGRPGPLHVRSRVGGRLPVRRRRHQRATLSSFQAFQPAIDRGWRRWARARIPVQSISSSAHAQHGDVHVWTPRVAGAARWRLRCVARMGESGRGGDAGRTQWLYWGRAPAAAGCDRSCARAG
jgi:hypothetical protein